MEAVLSRLQALTSDQLREEITGAGLKCGPLTATTRAIFERRLARALLENQAGDSAASETDGSGLASSANCAAQAEPLTNNQPVTGEETEAFSGTANTPEDVNEQRATQESPSLYYGVCPPLDDSLVKDDTLHVYVDKKKALRAVMTMKGARFKPFSSQEEAEKFSKGICDHGPSPHKGPSDEPQETTNAFVHRESPVASDGEAVNLEKANEFRTPRTQDLTAKLRKAVEKGDEEAFSQLVWSNPRYLIGSGDNPTIVQEGCRYNVLHVAAKENQPGIARLILETLESPEFMRLMYPDDQEAMLWQRICYIVDLYLNMPDKASNETPLHFACKFGCPEVVNVLCSHPAIDKNCRNKYSQKPSGVVCERKNKTKEIKQKITDYLEDRFYIPLLRATDNTLQPVIGIPWSPGSFEVSGQSLGPGMVESPKDPAMAVRAFVGPLSPSKADEFHRLWKTPPRDRARYFHNILKSDPDRGTERVGRELAHEMGHPWAEYWDFLDSFIDLSIDEGLNRLEDYLSRKSISEIAREECRTKESISSQFKTLPSGKSKQVSNSVSDGASPKNHPSEPVLGPAGDGRRSPPITEEDPDCGALSPVCNLLPEFESVSQQGGSVSCPAVEGENPVISGKGCLAPSGSERGCLDLGDSSFWGTWERNQATGEFKDQSSCSSEEYFTADEDTGGLGQRAGLCASGRGILGRTTPWACGARDRTSSGSSSSSYESIQSTPEDTSPSTGGSVEQGLFIEGESPTKLDNEVLLVVNGLNIDPQKYPCIIKWRSTVLAYPSSQRQSWLSTTIMKSHNETQASTPCRFSSIWHTGSANFISSCPRTVHLLHTQQVLSRQFGRSPVQQTPALQQVLNDK